MATVQERIGCPVCGTARGLPFFGLRQDGSYDPDARPPKLVLYAYTFAGRAQISTNQHPMPLNVAYGLRDALKAILTLVDDEIADAEGS